MIIKCDKCNTKDEMVNEGIINDDMSEHDGKTVYYCKFCGKRHFR